MAKYIDVNKLCEALKSMASVQYPDKQNTILGVVSSIENFPTADVVPKSDVVLASSDAVKMLMECHGYALTHDADIKEEVAREIFMDIDRVVEKYSMGDIEYPEFVGIIAELKKKHIGESDVKRDTV